ncbi:hypothetical protein [Gluconobacter cerinus]|uniref:hypothetical protein n=1 Tax=Gluconobacter cerinus TaxID=38307 RepID=UPI001B8B0CFD|nr:hypothetical protein [Gluconobacter cerinus]MBS1038129.1 hypothetical protein [Gluconobacter cerinus]
MNTELENDINEIYDQKIEYYFEHRGIFFTRILFENKDAFKNAFEDSLLKWNKRLRLWEVFGTTEDELKEYGLVSLERAKNFLA